MKKLFLMLLFILMPSIHAMDVSVEYIPDVYASRYNFQTGDVYNGQLGYIIVDGSVVFCVEPFNWVGGIDKVDNSYFEKFDSYTYDYMSMVANYADKYIQNRDLYHYMAAQSIIWRQVSSDGGFGYSASQGPFSKAYDISKELAEINDYVTNFLKKPNFNKDILKGELFHVEEFIDSNSVLSTFDIINNSKNEVWSVDDKLYIRFLSEELGDIKFVKKEGSGDPIYYYSQNKQDLASLKREVVNEFDINVQSNQAYYNDVRIEFVDKDSNELINSNIEFKINDNSYSSTNGIFLTKLLKGKYNIDLESVPYGYLKPSCTSFEIIDGVDNNYTHRVYLEKPTGVLNIKVEKEDFYEIYKDEQLITTFKGDKTLTLPLGKYKIVDHLNFKTYEIDINYQDQNTSVVEKNIFIPYQNYKEIEDTKNYCELNKKELPNTVNYIKIIKVILIIIIIIEILRHVKKIFKD